MENQRKLWFDQNDQPPKNYIWYKNGQYLEWIDGRWKPSKGMNNSNSGSGISEDMTEEQKMETRKNLGLYYEGIVLGEKTVKYVDQQQSDTLPNFAKISDDTPSKEDVVHMSGSSKEYLKIEDTSDGYQLDTLPNFGYWIYRVVLNDSQGNEPGIYFNIGETSKNFFDMLNEFTYIGEVTSTSKIDEKYLPEIPDTSDCLKRWDERTYLYDTLKEGDIVLREIPSNTPIIAPCDAMWQDNPIYINEDAIYITFNNDICGSEDSTIYIYDGESTLLYRIEVHVPVNENDQRSNTIYDANNNVIAVYGASGGNDFTIQPSEFTTGTMCITSSPTDVNANEIYGIKVYRRRIDTVPYEMKDGQLISRRVKELCYKVYGTISNDEFIPDPLETRTFGEVQNDFSDGAIISLVDYNSNSVDRIVYSAMDILKTSQGVVWNNIEL